MWKCECAWGRELSSFGTAEAEEVCMVDLQEMGDFTRRWQERACVLCGIGLYRLLGTGPEFFGRCEKWSSSQQLSKRRIVMGCLQFVTQSK
jgi:hypothetical protein